MKKPESIANIINDAKASGSHFNALRDNFRSRLSAFRQNRDREDQEALEADFTNVLEKWGIFTPDNLGEVIFSLKTRILVLAALPLMYGIFALFMRTFNSLMVFILLAIPCIFGVLATAWRVWVLKNSRFIPFTRWLRSGCGIWL